jgi:putative methanogenesis marker protein 8
MNTNNEHIMEVGKAKVSICDGRVTVLTEPLIKYCPTWERTLGISQITKEFAQEIVERRIKIAGLFKPDRIVESDELIFSFGASEMLYCSMSYGVIDAAVIVCDGAGTIISDNPKIVQGVGGWMSGIIKTVPILRVIEKLEERGSIVLNQHTAEIDPVAGVMRAVQEGYKNVAVTVAEGHIHSIPQIREIESKNRCNIAILSVCTGSITKQEAEILTKADLVWSCASKSINEVVGPKSILNTRRIKPIYALTEKGKVIVLSAARYYSSRMVLFRDGEPNMQPYPMI